MPLSRFFWFMILITFALIIVQIIGYSVIEYIILVIIIDLVLIEVSRELNKNKINSKIKEELTKRIKYIEDISLRIVHYLEQHPHSVKHIVEEQKVEFRAEMERMAKKSIEIENKLHRLRNSINSAFVMFDDRIKKIEGHDVEMTPDV